MSHKNLNETLDAVERYLTLFDETDESFWEQFHMVNAAIRGDIDVSEKVIATSNALREYATNEYNWVKRHMENEVAGRLYDQCVERVGRDNLSVRTRANRFRVYQRSERSLGISKILCIRFGDTPEGDVIVVCYEPNGQEFWRKVCDPETTASRIVNSF